MVGQGGILDAAKACSWALGGERSASRPPKHWKHQAPKLLPGARAVRLSGAHGGLLGAERTSLELPSLLAGSF